MGNGFCGWYFKCQNKEHTLAVIPACHGTKGKKGASIQLLTQDGAWNVPFAPEEFHLQQENPLYLTLGKNLFCEKGFLLNIHTSELTATGTIHFGPLAPPLYDFMGPLALVPGLECRHQVVSMIHRVQGSLTINGKEYEFPRGAGYWEGDRGRSFPREYAWTQCCFQGGSLMMAAAQVPLGPLHMLGTVAILFWQGKEYRLATYLGARVEAIGRGTVRIRQGRDVFTATLLERGGHPLRAPAKGAMNRTVREPPACRAQYHFQRDGRTLFSLESNQASFEYEFPF